MRDPDDTCAHRCADTDCDCHAVTCPDCEPDTCPNCGCPDPDCQSQCDCHAYIYPDPILLTYPDSLPPAS